MRQSPPPVRKLMSEESFWNEVFERIGEGGSLRGVARDHGIAYATLHDRIHAEDGRKRRYLERLTSRAMHHAARIEELVEMVESGEIDPQPAKVAIDARKWIASRFHPQQFSERLAMEARVEQIDVGRMYLDALREFSRRSREVKPGVADSSLPKVTGDACSS